MATILVIDLGTIPNDGTGDPLRTGGQDINANFAELNAKKLETAGYGGSALDLANAIAAIQANYVTTDTAQTITGLKTFGTLPQSTATPILGADLVTLTYLNSVIGAPPTGLEKVNDGFAPIGQDRSKSTVVGTNSFDLLDNRSSAFPDTDYGAAAEQSVAIGGGNKIPAGGFGFHFAQGAYQQIIGGFANVALGGLNVLTGSREVIAAGYANTANTNPQIAGMFAGGAFNELLNYWGNALGTRLRAATKGAVHVGIASELITEGVTQADRRIFTVGIGDVQANSGATFGDALFRQDGFRVRYNGNVEAPAFQLANVGSNPKNLATVEWVQTQSGSQTLQEVLDTGDDATSPDGFSQVLLDLQDGGAGSMVLRAADKIFTDPTVAGSEVGLTSSSINLSTIKGGYRAGSGSDGSGSVAVSLLSILNLTNNGTTNLINGLPIADTFNFNLLIPRPDLTANKDSFIPVIVNTKEADNKGVLTIKEENIDGSIINFGNVPATQVLDLSLYTVFVGTIVTGGAIFTIANQPAVNDSNTWQLMIKGNASFTLPPEVAPVDGTPAYNSAKWNIYTFTKVFPSLGSFSWNYVYTVSQIDTA